MSPPADPPAVSSSRLARARDWLAQHVVATLALMIGLRWAVDALRLVSRPGNYVDWEESYNATVGFAIWRADLWSQLFRLQYVEFCGGCTVVGLMAAPVLGLGGDHFLLWKALAMLWGAATLGVGFVAVDRWAGRAAAWAFAAMLAVPPSGLAEISLFLWGNHQETMLFVLGGLALAGDRPVAAAFVGGLAVWFCRTSLYAEIVLIPALWMLHPGRRALIAAAFFVGAAPILLPAADGADLGYRMGLRDNLLPGGLGYAALRATWLASPPAVGPALGPVGRAGMGALLVAAGLGGALVLVADRARGPRRVVIAVLPLTFAAVWSVTGFEVGEAHSLINVRYYAPWMGVLMLCAAVGGGPWLGAAGWRGRAALALIGAPLLVGVAGWADLTPRIDRDVFEKRATDLPALVSLVGRRFDSAQARRATSDDPEVERALRRIEGHLPAMLVCKDGQPRDEVLATLRDRPDEVRIGFGQSLAGCERDDAITPAWLAETNRWLAVLPADEARAVGAGMARRLVGSLPLPAGRPGRDADFSRVPAVVGQAVKALRVGLPADAPCPLCGAAALAAGWSCAEQPPKRVAPCLAVAIAGPEAAALARGTGWLLDRIPRKPSDLVEQLAHDLAPEVAAALREGRADPLDPLLRPDLVRAPEVRGVPGSLPSIPRGRGR